ncbi:hypothetical protein [Vogesella indigofera]|uniref:Uncharacterized protein n=1 Tax=Vogesella indigofera TaxID=45465 RepID=A0ABT5I8Y4_VOGIN|nr:hypothetical protein [Vogesella indigofera]MDC7692649.1 hypothetical protein [Vogesella indigofera]
MEKVTANRSESMRVRLAPDLMVRYEHQALRVGMTPATLAAYIIGSWVKSQEDQLRMQSVAVMDAARKMLPQVDEEQLEALTAGMLEGMAPALAKLQHAAKGQEGGGE